MFSRHSWTLQQQYLFVYIGELRCWHLTRKRAGLWFWPYLVVVDDHALQLHAHLHDGRKVLDAVERDLRDMQQPRHATDLHESSVRLDGLDETVAKEKQMGIGESGMSSMNRVVIHSFLLAYVLQVLSLGTMEESA